MKKRRHTKLVHEGQYVAEVEVELMETDGCAASCRPRARRCQQKSSPTFGP